MNLSGTMIEGKERSMKLETSQPTFPRWFLTGAAALVLCSIVLAGFSRLTGIGGTRGPATPVQSSVSIRFVDLPSGAMQIVRAHDNAELAVLASDGSGFMRGIARSLFRQRMLARVDKNEPFELAQRTDGKFMITDPALAHLSNNRIDLDGFGPTNTQSVAAILAAGLFEKTGKQLTSGRTL
jgi:putative photosynthetic complex assembly protein